MIGILKCTNTVKMKQIYKQIYEDEEQGKFYLVTENNTLPIFDAQTHCQCLLIDLMAQLLNKGNIEEPDIFLSNEKGEKNEPA